MMRLNVFYSPMHLPTQYSITKKDIEPLYLLKFGDYTILTMKAITMKKLALVNFSKQSESLITYGASIPFLCLINIYFSH